MAIKSAPYYWAECDGCGQRCDYQNGDISAWPDHWTAAEIAVEQEEWEYTDDRLLCPNCQQPS